MGPLKITAHLRMINVLKKKKMLDDPYSRILFTSEDGEVVRVYFDIPREVFELIVDISSLYNFDIDKAVSEAVIEHANRVLGGELKAKTIRVESSENVNELKVTLEKLAGMIKDLSMKVTQFEQLARDLSTGRIQPELLQRKPIGSISLSSIEVPELEEITSSDAKISDEDRAPLDAVLEDVLVVAVDEELIKEEEENREEEGK